MAAKWPARTWTPGDIAQDIYMNDVRDQLNELNAQAASSQVGLWTAIPFVASNFTADSGATLTIPAASVKLNRYSLIRKTVTWAMWVTPATLSAAANALVLIPPLPFARNFHTTRISMATVNGGLFPNTFGQVNGPNTLALYSLPDGPWQGSIEFGFTLIYETP